MSPPRVAFGRVSEIKNVADFKNAKPLPATPLRRHDACSNISWGAGPE